LPVGKSFWSLPKGLESKAAQVAGRATVILRPAAEFNFAGELFDEAVAA